MECVLLDHGGTDAMAGRTPREHHKSDQRRTQDERVDQEPQADRVRAEPPRRPQWRSQPVPELADAELPDPGTVPDANGALAGLGGLTCSCLGAIVGSVGGLGSL
jgi:hypothetical protein